MCIRDSPLCFVNSLCLFFRCHSSSLFCQFSLSLFPLPFFLSILSIISAFVFVAILPSYFVNSLCLFFCCRSSSLFCQFCLSLFPLPFFLSCFSILYVFF